MGKARLLACATLAVLFPGTAFISSPTAQTLASQSEDHKGTSARPGSPVAPLVVKAPGDVEISIQITPTVDSHELRVYADSGSFYRSTTIGLDGERSDAVHTFTWQAFPVGYYEVVGALLDHEGKSEVLVRGELKVVEP